MVAAKRIERVFTRRNDRRTIVKVGEVQVEFVHIKLNGKDTVKLNLPAGGRIEHIDLTRLYEKP